MKIGILGGSFDPIHNGHIHMAMSAQNSHCLDKVLFIPAGHSPNKDEQKMTDKKHRFNMSKEAINEFNLLNHTDSFIVSDFEIKRDCKSYTYLTLQELKKKYINDDLFFIMGADSLDYFEKWKNPDIISSLVTILVIVRENFSDTAIHNKIEFLKKEYNTNVDLVRCKPYNVSSTLIRERIKSNSNIKGMVPDSVIEYIKKNGLYE